MRISAGNTPAAPAIIWFEETNMHGIIYLIGLIVVVLFILSLLGLA